jgi:hypothetical protein
MAVLLGVTGQVYAQSTPRLIVNDLTNGSATWYSDKGKTSKIDAVPHSATEQTLYIDIQPAEGYWTTGDVLNGKVEKFVKPSAAGTRVGSIALAQYALTKVDGQTYAKNGAGVYQVTIPGMGTETEAGEITKFVLTADFYPYTDITASVADKELTYSGVEQKGETEVTFTGLLTGHKATITYTPAKGTTVNTYSNGSFGTDLKVTDDAGSDVTVGYSLKTTTAGKLTIKPAPLTVTAKDKTIKYGEEAANDGVTYTGFVNSETASVLGGTLSYAYKTKEDGSGDAYTKTSPVGTYYIIPSGLTSANYAITFKAGKLTVSNSPVVIGGEDDASATATIEVSPKEFTYNGKDQKPEVKVVMKADKKVIDSKEYTVTYKKGDTEVSETKDAGTYTVVISNKTGADYAFSGTTTANYVIKPVALTVTAKDKTIKYGDEAANDGVTYEGFVNSETASVLGGTLSYAYKTKEDGSGDDYTKTSPVGTYYIIPSGLTSANYDITFKAGKLTVSNNPVVIGGEDDASATATIEVSPKEFTYNGKDQKPEVKVVMKADKKVIDSKEYTVTYKKGDTEVSETKDAGTYTVVISNKEGSDYAFSGKTTADYTIKPKALTITADAKTKAKGEADPALTYKADGLVEGDAITGALARAEGEGVGEYAITQGTLSAGDNYTIAFTGAKLTIKDIKESFKVVVAESEGGSVSVSKIEASPGTQINMKIIPLAGYHLETITIKKSHGGEVQHDITFDAKGESWDYFLMPSDDVIITAVFEKDKAAQNIFIYKSYYGEVVANTISADENEPVNLVAHPAYDNCVLDELVVINDKGKQLDLTTSYDSKEGNIYTFMMTGNWVQVYSTFRGINDVVDGARPFGLDNRFYQLSLKNLNILQTTAETKDVQIAMSLNANIFCQVADDGSLMMEQGEDVGLMIGGLKKGNFFRIDHDGEIVLENPDIVKIINDAFPQPAHILTRGEDTAIIKPGVAYEVVEDGNLELVLKGSAPLVLKSIIVEGPEPTAINRLQADDEAADIYDLSGRKVDPTSLRKGMYIRNGKKIIIK